MCGMNVVEPILFQCRTNSPAPAICAPGTEFHLVSYARLERFIHNVSRKAIELGLAPGQIVALYVVDPTLHAALILGLTRVGVITLSGRNPDLPKELSVAALITDTAFPYVAQRLIRADANWLAGDGTSPDPAKLPKTKPDDICRIILTSGTTGEAKAVALSHRMVADRIARHTTVFGSILPQCSRTYCDLGFTTSLGFQFLFYMLWRGGMIALPGLQVEPLIRAFVDFQIQNMITAPSGLATFLRIYEANRSLQHKLDMVMTGGSLLSPMLAERARARISSNIVAAYGSTETSMVASAPAQTLARTPGAVGYVMPGMSVDIVDPAGKALPSGAEGRVRVRGPYSAEGYFNDPAQSQTSFRDGWFYPGDYGSLTPDGMLVISGREKAIINLGGDKLKPEMVEEVIKSHGAIEEAGVFSIINELGIEQLWSVVVPRGQWSEEGLRAHCETMLPPAFIPLRFLAVDRIPLNAMGKIERAQLPDIARRRMI